MKEAVIEVGVNQGQHTAGLQSTYGCDLYGFEPIPILIEKLKKKFFGNPKIHLILSAVDVEERKRKFFLSANDSNTDHQYGCSSLHKFSENIGDVWPGRRDFSVSEEIEVETIRLDTVIRREGITKIPYLHCDAQGNDIRVLESLGEFHHIVSAGVIEVSLTVSLYQSDNSIEEARTWLTDKGFMVSRVKPDYRRAEANLFFERRL